MLAGEGLNCKIHYMWYRMPMGRDAVSEAKAAAVRNRMAAIRCTARLIARIGTRELDRALGKAVCQQLKQVEEALELNADMAQTTIAARMMTKTMVI